MFFGIQGYFVAGGDNGVAKVGKAEIPASEYRQRMNEQMQRMRAMMGESFNAEFFSTPQYKRQVVDQLVDEELMTQAGAAAGVAGHALFGVHVVVGGGGVAEALGLVGIEGESGRAAGARFGDGVVVGVGGAGLTGFGGDVPEVGGEAGDAEVLCVEVGGGGGAGADPEVGVEGHAGGADVAGLFGGVPDSGGGAGDADVGGVEVGCGGGAFAGVGVCVEGESGGACEAGEGGGVPD